MSFRWMIAGFLIAGLHAAEPAAVTWATPAKPEWDGWVKDVDRMRAARRPQPASGCLHSETVVWDSYHDVNQSRLADGRVLSLQWKGDEWKVLDGWKRGKKLLLCYDETNGASLLDPDSETRFLINGGRQEKGDFAHPIDAYLSSLNARSSYDMMSAGYEALRLWRLEIDRTVRRTLAKKHLPEQERKEFIELTAARVRYCELQGSFGASAIHADIGGTMAGPLGSSYSVGIYRDAYRQLAELAEHLNAYDQEPGK
ncbi:MAG: hypothetical protein FJ410_00940 [Verrucomicrobia bacterium]|nr:hypothetical protein [Verrucomicrobiota bacterium]